MKITKKQEPRAVADPIPFDEQTSMFESEKSYRANSNWNYSALKDFDTKGALYYHKKYILKEKEKEEKSNEAMYLGSLVDCLLLTPEFFDEKYFIYKDIEVVGQSKTLVDNLYSLYVKNKDKGKDVFDLTKNLPDAFDMTKYNSKKEIVAFKGKDFDYILDLMLTDKMQNYFNSLVSNYNKIAVFESDISLANNIVVALKTHPYTADLCNMVTKDNVEVINQHAIFFEIKGHKFKALLDKIIIDHNSKTIFPLDLKCTWELLNFAFNRLKNRYYLQEGVYNLALQAKYPDFTIAPPRYILAHSANQLAPVIAETDEDMLYESLNGFTTMSGKKYKGVYDLIDDLEWHYKNDTWNTTKYLYDNDGVIKLKKIGID